MQSVITFVGAALLILVGVACAGCADQTRSSFDLQTPRIYLWTSFEPEYLRQAMEVRGLSVTEERGEVGGLFSVSGTGTLRWPSVEIAVGESDVVVNGVRVEAYPDAYGNVTVYEDGRVVPHKFPPFER